MDNIEHGSETKLRHPRRVQIAHWVQVPSHRWRACCSLFEAQGFFYSIPSFSHSWVWCFPDRSMGLARFVEISFGFNFFQYRSLFVVPVLFGSRIWKILRLNSHAILLYFIVTFYAIMGLKFTCLWFKAYGFMTMVLEMLVENWKKGYHFFFHPFSMV